MKKTVINKQKVFIFISILFLAFCVIFYGFRFIYYYRKFNRKDDNGQVIQLLSNVVKSNSETVTTGDGLYNVGNEYIFKGSNVNNYVMYSGLLWRIVKINSDSSISLVTNDSINEFMWGTKNSDYKTSQIRKWLNKTDDNTGIFYNNLYNPDNYLKETVICLNKNSSLASSSSVCDEKLSSDYVGLLSVFDYTNSIVSENTYLNINNEFWLSTMSEDNNAWFVDSDKVSKTVITDSYGVRPSITLNSTVAYEIGNGTKEEPYAIGYNDGLTIGDYIKLGNDSWIVYEINNDNIRLALSNYYDNGNVSYKFANNNNFSLTSTDSLAYFLNNTYYENLTYKDLIVTNDWYVGSYDDDFTNVFSDKVSAKVGLFNIADIKLNNEAKNYYLLTKGSDNKIFGFDMSGYLFESSTTQNRYIKPAITIKKNKIISGSGIMTDPFILEA